jgi:hypothetical protein
MQVEQYRTLYGAIGTKVLYKDVDRLHASSEKVSSLEEWYTESKFHHLAEDDLFHLERSVPLDIYPIDYVRVCNKSSICNFYISAKGTLNILSDEKTVFQYYDREKDVWTPYPVLFSTTENKNYKYRSCIKLRGRMTHGDALLGINGQPIMLGTCASLIRMKTSG